MTRRRHKYGAQPTTVDGIRFDSKREAARYAELKLLVKAGEIHALELQPELKLHAVGGKQIGRYFADFRYRDADGNVVVEDAKGYRTALYRHKKKHVEAEYGIVIQEV